MLLSTTKLLFITSNSWTSSSITKITYLLLSFPAIFQQDKKGTKNSLSEAGGAEPTWNSSLTRIWKTSAQDKDKGLNVT